MGRNVVLLSLGLVALVGVACSQETVKEVPVERIVTQEVVKEVPVEKIVEVEKETVRTVVVEKPVEVVKEVVKEVKVPGKTVVVEVEKEVVRTVEVEKPVIIQQIVVATPTAVPIGPGPSGELRVAEADVAFPNTMPCKFVANAQQQMMYWSAYDTVYYRPFEGPGISLIGLGESWSYDPTETELTWKLRKGVEFDGGWGEVRAEDWDWAWNQQFCEGSLHSGIFDRLTYGKFTGDPKKNTVIIDDHTIKFLLTEPSVSYLNSFGGPGGMGSFTVFSKNKHDTLGRDKADRDLSGGTGPFRMLEWDPGDRITLEARDFHYRRVPEYRTVRVLEIPEPAVQVAALMAKEIDVATLPTIDAARVEKAGIRIVQQMGDNQSLIHMQGRFCFGPTGTLDGKGEVVPPRPGYDPSLPWIGGCDLESQEWENARLVRNAVALGIDRQPIVDNILGGFGWVAGRPSWLYGQAFQRFMPMAAERGLDWVSRYDPEEAKALLAKAGWPNGFDVEMVVTTGGHPMAVEMGEAIQRDLKEIGINVSISVQTYTGNRVGVVAREKNQWWLQSLGGGAPSSSFPATEEGYHTRPPESAFNPGWELPEAVRLGSIAKKCKTQECLDDTRIALYNWHQQDQGMVAIVNSTGAMGVNPDKIGEWRQPMGIGVHPANRGSLEYVQKPR